MTLDRSSMSVNRERAWPSYPPNHHERIRRKKTSRSGSSQRGAGPWKEDWKKGNGWATDRPRLGARMPASWTGILPCNQYPLFFVPQPTPSARRPAQATRRATGRRIPCASQVREAPWVVAAAHECCGFPPLWHMGPGGTGPSNFRSRRVRVGSVAFHSIVGTGSFCGVSRPGWNPALHWAMSSGEQPVRPFVEGRSGVVGPRVGCRSSTAPASGRTPNAARARKAFWAASACHSLVRREQSGRFGSWSNRAFPRGAIATGGTGAFDARAGGGPLRGADGGPLGWFICGSTSSGGTIGTRNGGSKG